MWNEFRQFRDNYRIYKRNLRANRYKTYEKGDWKFLLYEFIICLIPALIFFGIITFLLVNFMY